MGKPLAGSMIHMKHLDSLRDISELYTYLVSDESGYTTGAEYTSMAATLHNNERDSLSGHKI